MNKAILTQVKRAIDQNLDDNTYIILKSNATYLSKRYLSNIIKFMRQTRTRGGATTGTDGVH